ncbi:protein of unknown function [Pseudomonas mediterranea]
MTSRTICSRSTQAEVVTSPAMIATPVFTRVSHATRANLSSAMMASSTASEIWSAILSGCPSDTDSEVKREYSLISMFSYKLPMVSVASRSLKVANLDLETIT